MITTEIYNGQGLGNQLFCYVVTRCIALRNGYSFGIMRPEKFKCQDFLELDLGGAVIGGVTPIEGEAPRELPEGITNYYRETAEHHPKYKCDIRRVDEALLEVPDGTKIDGVMQAEAYFEAYRGSIKQWLAVKRDKDCTEYSNEDTCIVNFRGGEYKYFKELFLGKHYWGNAINNVICRYGHNVRFVVITDDPPAARRFFPKFEICHFEIGKDYSILKNARYAILSNSSFAFWPIWTSDTIEFVIAPKYWARHNISDGFWSCGYNLYKRWNWQDRNGDLFSYAECVDEFASYVKKNRGIYGRI